MRPGERLSAVDQRNAHRHAESKRLVADSPRKVRQNLKDYLRRLGFIGDDRSLNEEVDRILKDIDS
jgi:hypothetical protein